MQNFSVVFFGAFGSKETTKFRMRLQMHRLLFSHEQRIFCRNGKRLKRFSKQLQFLDSNMVMWFG